MDFVFRTSRLEKRCSLPLRPLLTRLRQAHRSGTRVLHGKRSASAAAFASALQEGGRVHSVLPD